MAQNHAKAREWYEKAADEGDASAMVNLGLLYANGQGVTQDHAKALQWQEAYAAKVEPEELGKSGEETARALQVLAWYALFVGAKTNTRPVGHCRANVCFDLLEHQRFASTARSACLLGRAERSSPEAA